MQVIDNIKVVVSSFDELKKVLTENNTYTYVYIDSDLTLTEGFVINSNKKRVTIDGLYQNIMHTFTNYKSDANGIITADESNQKIVVKNMKIISSHPYGVIYVPSDALYSNVLVEYNNIIFNGVQLSYNYYGITKIIDSTVTIEQTNGNEAQRVCDCNKIIIGGKSNITSSATTSTVFLLKNDTSYLKFLPYCDVTITTNKEIMNGTTLLDLSILHDANVNFITGNGFAITTYHGARNVLIDERAVFNFIENSHARVPMWNVHGNFTVNEDAKVFILNTYANTPTDNYNIYFKGQNQTLTLNNPANFTIYTKNANILYTNNPINFKFKIKRINMWVSAQDFKDFGTIEDLPTLYWYKEEGLSEISGIINQTTTQDLTTNFTAEDLSQLPDLSNFVFQMRKALSIGSVLANIHPIIETSDNFSGYTNPYAGIKIEHEGLIKTITADAEGYFEYTWLEKIPDETYIEITICSQYLFLKRIIISPFHGELTLLDAPTSIRYTSLLPSLVPKENETIIKVADGRITSSAWKLYVSILKPLESINGYKLSNALVFKNFDDTITVLNEVPTLIYTGTSNNGTAQLYKITYSKEKGVLLDLTDKYLEANEEYQTKIIWSIKE